MGDDKAPHGKNEIKNRLLEIISSMPEADKRDLLEVLEIMQISKPAEKREHQRKAPSTNMGILMHKVVLSDCIQNISQTGAFIETVHSFDVGQKLSLTILLTGNDEPLTLDGTIIRVDPDGVAVKFDKTISNI